VNQPPDPFEFLKNLWGPMGLPLAGVASPILDQGEIERRIAELRSVENWLNMNLNVLRMTIQGLEMHKSSLAAMREAAKAQDRVGPADYGPAAPPEAPPDIQRRADSLTGRGGPSTRRRDPAKK